MSSHVRTERPDSLPEFIGQAELVENLSMMLAAAKRRGESPRHVLLSGPAGLGKTSIARLIAGELGVALHSVTGTVLRDDADVARLFNDVDSGDVLFIDEIHSCGKKALVALLTAAEDLTISVRGKRNQAPTEVELLAFVLVGASTEPGRLPRPLLDRFGFKGVMQYYTDAQIALVLSRYAKAAGFVAEQDAVELLAPAGRGGVPRVALDVLQDARDLADVRYDGRITAEVAAVSLERRRIDSAGLDEQDRQVLTAVAVEFVGGPVGVERIASSLGIDPMTVSRVVEPFLIRRRLIALSGSGRIARPAAYEHLGIRRPVYLPGV